MWSPERPRIPVNTSCAITSFFSLLLPSLAFLPTRTCLGARVALRAVAPTTRTRSTTAAAAQQRASHTRTREVRSVARGGCRRCRMTCTVCARAQWSRHRCGRAQSLLTDRRTWHRATPGQTSDTGAAWRYESPAAGVYMQSSCTSLLFTLSRVPPAGELVRSAGNTCN